MRVIDLATTDPYRNLATEEYLLKTMPGDYFMLWQNEPCIVVGRNQNTLAEINREYVDANGIRVVRRLTGGGAVFHDLGNLNYTFIEEGVEDQFGNYAVFARPVIEALAALGVTATLSGRNDLLLEGKKFCGNAQTMWHGRMMHHGCILFDANVDRLTDALKVNPLKIQSKGIQSVRSRVTNVKEHLPEPITVGEFRNILLERALAVPGNELYTLTPEDEAAIDRLYRETYSTYAWNYGYAKAFSFQKDTRFAAGTVSIRLELKDNAIAACRVFGDFFGIREVSEFEAAMVGVPYTPDDLLAAFDRIRICDYFAGITPQELVQAML